MTRSQKDSLFYIGIWVEANPKGSLSFYCSVLNPSLLLVGMSCRTWGACPVPDTGASSRGTGCARSLQLTPPPFGRPAGVYPDENRGRNDNL